MSPVLTVTEHSQSYPSRKQRLSDQLRAVGRGAVRLKKDTSNLFRDRVAGETQELSVRDFNHLLEADPENQTLTAEGMITYEDFVDAALPHGLMPPVVPQLKSITLGGALAGVGIESTSFRRGLTHEPVIEADVLIADGSVITCRPDNEHSDLYYALPNSYGTLGYALRVKVQAVPVKPYVHIHHRKYTDAERFFAAIDKRIRSGNDIDFLDGSVYGPKACYLTEGRFLDDVRHTSDYTYMNIYYRSIRDGFDDYLTIRDYLWRWDTDWFWCSKNLYAQNPLIRRLAGQRRLNSVTYTKIMRWNSKWDIMRRLNALAGYRCESVIQDIDIPIDRAGEFLDFLFQEIGVLPIWICPVATSERSPNFPLFPLRSDTNYINFGFWDSTKTRERRPQGYLNRKIERKTAELGGIKSLYSDIYFEEDEFWGVYNREEYFRIKRNYDPDGKFLNLYDKCVLRK